MVTGASGFIGSTIMEYLVNKGHEVYGCGRKNISATNNKYIVCDLSERTPDIAVDLIIHVAGGCLSNSVTFDDFFDNNVIVTRNIVKYAKLFSVKKIIYVGTVKSFGKVDEVLSENSPHNNPDLYGLTKYMAEQMIINSGIPYCILSLPGVVGKNCTDIWIMKTAKALYNDENLIYYNGKGMFNNIVDVQDICSFIEKSLINSNKQSETYLLGSTEMMTVEDVVCYIKEQLSSNSQVCCKEQNGNSFYLDVSRAVAAGFQSRPLKDMLKTVCEEVVRKA